MRPVVKTARSSLAFVLLLVPVLIAPARADFPALGRPLALGPLTGDTQSQMHLAGEVWAGGFARSPDAGASNAHLGPMELGGRFRVTLARGPWDVSADVTQDTRFNVDSREYPSRLSLARGAIGPLSARLATGFENGDYDGTDLEFETGAIPLPPRSAGRPRLVAWTRLRKLRFEPTLLTTPALGLVFGPARSGARGLSLGLSVQCDVAPGGLPTSFAMAVLHWSASNASEEEPSQLGSPFGGEFTRRWFVHASGAFPLDERQYERVAVGIGAGFDSPF